MENKKAEEVLSPQHQSVPFLSIISHMNQRELKVKYDGIQQTLKSN